MKTFFLSSNACPRRKTETQRVHDYLVANGLSFTLDYGRADLVVVSTCGAVEGAEDVSVAAVEYYLKRKAESATLVITGCLPKINEARLLDIGHFVVIPPLELEKFDRVIAGPVEFRSVPEPIAASEFPFLPILERVRIKLRERKNLFEESVNWFLKQPRIARLLKSRGESPDAGYFPEEVAKLRIAYGCLGECSYCAIRFAMGRLQSEPLERVVDVFKGGLRDGFKRFSLIAGDVGSYGLDIGTSVVELLNELFKIEGDYKISINEFNAQWLVKYIDELEKIFSRHSEKIDYIIVPVQSGSDRMLKLMKRPYRIAEVLGSLKRLRSRAPSARITTHLMAGFPQETEEDFDRTKQVLKDFDFAFVEVYAYSDRPKTEASTLKGKVPRAIVEKRARILKAMAR